jgi:hypothetical protein
MPGELGQQLADLPGPSLKQRQHATDKTHVQGVRMSHQFFARQESPAML